VPDAETACHITAFDIYHNCSYNNALHLTTRKGAAGEFFVMAPMNSRYLLLSALSIFLSFPLFGKGGSDTGVCAFSPKDASFEHFPNCVRQDTKGNLSISSKYVKKLRFKENGLAEVYSSKRGWMYVNRKGGVVISGVAVMDNGADFFCDGLVRFSKDGKWGFADESGLVVVPPIYDGAMPFEKGIARVCKGCESKCAEPGCEHHVLAGGEWLCVNTKGKVITCPP